MDMQDLVIKELDVASVMTKSAIPLGGYCVNPYVGCPHACKYCYASFMKRFTGHTEEWGDFVDVKVWKPIANPRKYAGERVTIGTVTDGYNQMEAKFGRTRAVLEQLKDSGAKITICTKSDLVLRDLDLIKSIDDVTVSWSVNTLDDSFRADMDRAASIEQRLEAMKKFHDEGVRTVCFVSPIFPGITDVIAIMDRARDICDCIWLENLNLHGGFKSKIFGYIDRVRPDLKPLYEQIYNKKNLDYWYALEAEVARYTKEHDLPYVNNYMPDERSEQGKPFVVNYLFHEQVKNTDNSGRRNV